MKMICPNCKNVCEINEYVVYCSKCGRIFTEYLNVKNKYKNDIGNRRSLENVDQD